MFRSFQKESRELRKRQTPQELKLWKILRSRRFDEFKFRRQHVIDGYIVDFCCLEKRVVIEIDGKFHRGKAQQREDLLRDKELKQKGYKVLRVWNSLIDRNIEEFFIKLERVLDSPSPQPSPRGGQGDPRWSSPSPQPSPQGGEGDS